MLVDNLNPDVLLWSNGIPFLFDPVRSKWISVAEDTVKFSIAHKNLNKDQWMYYQGIPSVNSGFQVRGDSILKALSVRCSGNVNATFILRKNTGTLVRSIQLSAEPWKAEESIDVNLDAGDWLKAFLQVDSGNVDYPQFYAVVSRRN